ncbi:aldo/keto reductase [Streptomyces sp. NBC_00316]|uniref:aldo/keto reductase n=1 Tax=Streptomyces sp. NBC_00316 TaxID=2975710 RepID=UPI002E27D675|nr:aldo/keto reductase [Streptomyces sp. NBC_00316]
MPLEETWGALAEAVTAGKARYLGLSEVTVAQIERAQVIHPVTTVQSEFSLWTRDVQAEVLPHCTQHGIGLLPYSPLGRGFLLGRFASFDDLPVHDQRRRLPRFQQDNLRANLDIATKVREVADRIGATPAQVALAWLLAQGEHVVPSPAPRPRSTSPTTQAPQTSSCPRPTSPTSTPSPRPSAPGADGPAASSCPGGMATASESADFCGGALVGISGGSGRTVPTIPWSRARTRRCSDPDIDG